MIFEIAHNLDHITESGVYDAELLRFPGDQDVSFANPDIVYTDRVPPRIEFVGNLQQVRLSDFPYLDRNLPLMSKKLLLTLLSAGEFDYKLFPTRIYDVSIKDKVMKSYDSSRTAYEVSDSSLYTDEFIIVQISQWMDILDYKNTIVGEIDFAANSRKPLRASELDDIYIFTQDIERLALKVSEDELPGVLRIRGLGDLLCASKTKDACQKAGIVGVRFTPIPTPQSHGVRPIEGGFRSIAETDLPPHIR